MIEATKLLEMLESSFGGIWITRWCGQSSLVYTANAALLGVSKGELEG